MHQKLIKKMTNEKDLIDPFINYRCDDEFGEAHLYPNVIDNSVNKKVTKMLE